MIRRLNDFVWKVSRRKNEEPGHKQWMKRFKFIPSSHTAVDVKDHTANIVYSGRLEISHDPRQET